MTFRAAFLVAFVFVAPTRAIENPILSPIKICTKSLGLVSKTGSKNVTFIEYVKSNKLALTRSQALRFWAPPEWIANRNIARPADIWVKKMEMNPSKFLYRGIRITVDELEEFSRIGLQIGKTQRKRIDFAKSPETAAHFAFEPAGSDGWWWQRKLSIIIQVKNEGLEPSKLGSYIYHSWHDVPIQQVVRIYVFDPTQIDTNDPFVEYYPNSSFPVGVEQ